MALEQEWITGRVLMVVETTDKTYTFYTYLDKPLYAYFNTHLYGDFLICPCEFGDGIVDRAFRVDNITGLYVEKDKRTKETGHEREEPSQ